MTRKTLHMCIAAMLATVAFGAQANHPGEDKFKMMDTNGDGSISMAEHDAAVTKMFTDMDANKDGFVTSAEMDARHAKMMKGEHKGMDMKSADKIKAMDTDGDGKLSAAEHAAGANEMFGKMDKDGDGKLSKAEMNEGHDKMMSKDKAMKDDAWKDKEKGTSADMTDHSGHDAATATAPPKDNGG